MNGVYATVDFECCGGEWFCFGLAVCAYPSGKYLSTFECRCERDAGPDDFWNRHQVAYENNMKAPALPVDEAEKRLCQEVRHMLTVYPWVHFVSDNPTHDVSLLNTILDRHGHPPVSQRLPDMYLQTVCTWSYRRALTESYGLHSMELESYIDINFPRTRDVDEAVAVEHMPLHDCAKILSAHFRHIDFIRSMRLDPR
jgi:hypothetical protein